MMAPWAMGNGHSHLWGWHLAWVLGEQRALWSVPGYARPACVSRELFRFAHSRV